MKKLLLTTVFSSLLVVSCYAAHLAGGEIEYRCIGLRKWEVKLVLYTECGGTPFAGCTNGSQTGCLKTLTVKAASNTLYPGLNSGLCNTVVQNFSISLTSYKIESLSKANESICGISARNACNNNGTITSGTNTPNMEAFYYKGILDMSSAAYAPGNACSYWQISMEECCRNGTPVGVLNYYLDALINIHHNTPSLKNNSPVFSNPAEFVVCSNQPFVYNMGAIDEDGDSLTYKFIKVKHSSGTPTTYVSPYSEIYPFPLNGGAIPHSSYPQPNGPFVVLDSVTGDVSFNASNSHPTTVINGVLVLEVTQWSYDQNGIPFTVGITYRDVMFAVRNCGQNNLPQLATTPQLNAGKATHHWQVIAGEQLCFTVSATDDDDGAEPMPSNKLDTTYISWNEGVVRPSKLTFLPDYNPNAIPKQRPREDRWRFCWQTELSDTSKYPYTFTVTAADNNCPNVGRVTKAFSVKIIPQADLQITKNNMGCYGNWKVNVFKQQPTSQHFLMAKMLISKQPNTNVLTNNNAHETIAVNPNPTGSSVPLLLTNTVNFTQAGKYLLRVEVIMSNTTFSQFFYDTITVVYRPNPTVTLTSLQDSVCNTTTSLQLAGLPAMGSYMGKSINTSGLINLQDTSLLGAINHTYKYFYTDNFGCVDSAVKTITLLPSPSLVNTFIGNLNPLQQSLFQYTSDSIVGVYYTWEAIGGNIVSVNNHQAIVNWTDSGVTQLKVTASNICGTNSISKQLQVVPSAGIQINKSTTGCFGKWRVDVLKKYPTQQDFLLVKVLIASQPNPDVFVATNAHQAIASNPNPAGIGMPLLVSKTVNFNQMGKYILRVEVIISNSNISQYFYDTITVLNQPTPSVTLTTAKDTVCKNSIAEFEGTPNGGSYLGMGINQLGQVNMAALLVNTSYIYQYIFTDNFGCKDTATRYLFIMPDPSVISSIMGSLTPKKQTVQQYSTAAIGNVNYSWETTKGIVQSSNNHMATILFTDTGFATVKVTASNNCGANVATSIVEVMPNVGLNFTTDLKAFKLYPNPTHSDVFMEFESSYPKVHVELLNNMMQQITEQTLHSNQGKISHHFSASALSHGLYFVRLTYGDNQKIVKLLITRK